MNRKSMFVPLAFGLALTVALMRLLSLSGNGLPVARAGSYTVCPAGPPTCDYSVIQDAVDAAGDDDVIKVAAGIYNDVNNRGGLAQVVYIAKSVTIRGGYTTAFAEPPDSEANPTTLDAGDQGRVIYIEGNITPTIEGLRITGGDATALETWEDGGGVLIKGATVTLIGNQIYDNSAHEGGGVHISANSLVTLTKNTVSTNTASGSGGGVWLENSVAMLSDNNIIFNTADDGGGLLMWQCSNATLTGNTISHNTANVNGGGWQSMEGDDIAFNNNTIAYNTANWGGGVNLTGNGIELIGNTIISNTATDHGGGLSLSGENTLVGNTISFNKAVEGAGGICLNDGNPTLINNTIADNQTDHIGGGVQQIPSSGVATYIGNTFSGNSADYGGGISTGDATLNYNTFISNTATSQGGGLYLSGAPVLNGNTIFRNSAQSGGGILFNESDATLTNNLIFDNQADFGSGISAGECALRMLHTTIARNTGGDGVGIYVSSGTVALTNTIIVSQTVGIFVGFNSSATLESTLWGTTTWANTTDWSGDGTIITGTVNIWDDPDFVDYQANDYHIGGNSAAIDQGIDVGVDNDIDGDDRPLDGDFDGVDEFDIGADEFLPNPDLTITKQAFPDPVQPGERLTYTISITNTGNVDLHATITDTLAFSVTLGGTSGGTLMPPGGTVILPDGRVAVTWTAVITAPGDVWMGILVVTVEEGHDGPLTNLVEVTTEEGVAGSARVTVNSYKIYLPLVLRSY